MRKVIFYPFLLPAGNSCLTACTWPSEVVPPPAFLSASLFWREEPSSLIAALVSLCMWKQLWPHVYREAVSSTGVQPCGSGESREGSHGCVGARGALSRRERGHAAGNSRFVSSLQWAPVPTTVHLNCSRQPHKKKSVGEMLGRG